MLTHWNRLFSNLYRIFFLPNRRFDTLFYVHWKNAQIDDMQIYFKKKTDSSPKLIENFILSRKFSRYIIEYSNLRYTKVRIFRHSTVTMATKCVHKWMCISLSFHDTATEHHRPLCGEHKRSVYDYITFADNAVSTSWKKGKNNRRHKNLYMCLLLYIMCAGFSPSTSLSLFISVFVVCSAGFLQSAWMRINFRTATIHYRGIYEIVAR